MSAILSEAASCSKVSVARARAFVDLDQLLEQPVPLGGLIDQLQVLGRRRLEVGAAVPVEAAAGLVQVVLVDLADLDQQLAAGGRLLDPLQQLLVGVGQPLVVPRRAVETGHRLQRRQVLRIDLQHALVDRDGLAIVAQPIAHQRRELHRARHPLGRILGQEELPLGDLDHPWPVLVLLVVGPQPPVRLGAARVDLGDQALERLGRRVDVVQLLVEDLRAQQGQLDGAAGLGRQRRLPVEDPNQHRPVALGVVEAGQRLQRLGVGGQQVGDLLPGLARARAVGERAFDQAGQLAQVLGLLRGIGDHALDLQIEDARQILVAAERRVDLHQAAQRLGVVGIEADHFFQPRRRAGRVLQLGVEDLGDAPVELQLLVRVGGVLGVQLQHPDQIGRLPGALEDPLEARQRVAIAGDRLQDLARGPLPLHEIAGALIVDDQHPPQQADPLLLGGRELDLLAQRVRQAREVPLALVDLDQRPHRHRVVRIGPQDLLVDLDGALGVPQLLAVKLGDPAQDVHPRRRLGLGGGLALEQRRQPVPALGLEQDPALRFARPSVGRRDLLGALPGQERPLGIAQLLLGDRRDLLEPRQQLLGGGARDPRPLVGELQQIGQRRPVPLLPEVLGVGPERDLVLGLELEHRVQVDGGLIGVAQPIAIEGGQLQHDARAPGRIGHRAQLALAQLGQPRVVVSSQIQLDQLLGGRSARRLEQRDLVVDPLRLGPIV